MLNSTRFWLIFGILFSGIAYPFVIFIHSSFFKETEVSANELYLYLFGAVIATIFIVYAIKRTNRVKNFILYCFTKTIECYKLCKGHKFFAHTDHKFNCCSIDDEFQAFSIFMKDFICDNQGYLANYNYNGGRHHKEIKKYILNCDIDKDNLKAKIHELDNYLQDGLIEAIKINRKRVMESFFMLRNSRQLPRLTVKGVQDGNITDIYREKEDYFTQYSIESNTGHFDILKDGNYYLCNNIPVEAYQGRYRNPRLVNEKVKDYIDNSNHDHEKWVDCWAANRDENETLSRPNLESCYRSTLIIPMTLLNNEGLTPEFRKHFGIPNYLIKTNIERAIWGFVCFDHVDVDFFRNPMDIRVGYMVADLISLYLIENLNYRVCSDTYNSATELLER